MGIKQEIITKLQVIVRDLTKKDIKIQLSIPADPNHGDFSSNVALQLSKELSKNPLTIAEEIVSIWKNAEDIKGVAKIEAVKPGFINFTLAKDFLITHVEEVLKDPKKVVGISKTPKYPKAIVEFSSPNIAKPFTIGHLRSTIIGNAIANILAVVGYEVYRDNHLGDWGTQFGKQIYAIKTWANEEALEKSENPIKDLVSLYVKFHEEAERRPELEDEARLWFKKLEDGDPEARRLWQKCIDWSFKEFDKIYKELGISFTENNGVGFGEAYFENKMKPVIQELEDKGLLKEDKGAKLVYFPDDKLPPLMIIKKDGATLYATRDLATDKFRLNHYGKDILVINEVGAEQSLYWKQIFEIEYMLGWYKPGQRIHIGHGMFRFKQGKMSTRKGNVIWLEDVIQEAENRALALMKHEVKIQGSQAISRNKKFGAAGKNILGIANQLNISKEVAMGALKWNDLKKSAHLDIKFDWDEILSMQGNSGPYVQYTYARTQSVLRKEEDTSFVLSPDYTLNDEEMMLLRLMFTFPETVEKAAEELAPNKIADFLYQLAKNYNLFYQKHRIVNAPTKLEKDFRLALTKAVGIVLKQGLDLLGIAAPERM